MRKNIALILALAMLFSVIMPMSVSAASDNSIDRVPTVSDSKVFDADDAPVLRIEARNEGEFGTDEFSFRLDLTNAEFDDAFDSTAVTLDGVLAGATVSRRTDSSYRITVPETSTAVEVIEVALITEMDDEGEARVTIDPLGSAVSAGILTFAIVADGDTIATAVDDEKVGRGKSEAGTIIIDEATVSALDTESQEFRVRLPRDVEWDEDADTGNVRFEGLSWDDLTVSYSDDARDMFVEFDITAVSQTRGSILIDPAAINVTRDARFGDIEVSIKGLQGQISDASGLKIAEYVDFEAAVEVDEVIEMYAGRVDEDYEVEIEIDSSLDFTLSEGRFIEFEVPSWAAIVNATPDEGEGEWARVNDQMFEYQVGENEGDVVAKFELVAEANAVPMGETAIDLEMIVSGAGVPETEVIVAEVQAPVSVEVGEQEAPFQIGTQRQLAPEIIITENYPGAIMDNADNNLIEVFVRDQFASSMRFDDVSYEVLAGDLEVDDVEVAGDDDEIIRITVDVASDDEAAQIRLYDIEMTLDRTVPMGIFRLDIGGSALIDYDGNNDDWEFVTRVARFDYIEVGTPVTDVDVDVEKATVGFTVGQNSYMVDGEMMVMDVAPFISDDRLMVPVRYLEALFGMQPIWNENARTVTVMYEDKVYEMTIGSEMLRVNGAPYLEMDAAAQIVDGRTFVPASRFARAMNIPYEWDAVTQTATFN